YAEDPAHGFLPSAGRVVAYEAPAAAVPSVDHGDRRNSQLRVRLDGGVETGTEVGTEYDPMLAKLIVHGPDPAAALSGLDRALGALVLRGRGTTPAALRALRARPGVRAGELDPGMIERLGAEIAPPTPAPVLAAVALVTLLGPPPSDDPWDARDGW